MKQATEQDILTELEIQLSLIGNGTTTAHDVKISLRYNGFSTTQKEVSDVLKSNTDVRVCSTFNGTYLIYFIVDYNLFDDTVIE